LIIDSCVAMYGRMMAGSSPYWSPWISDAW
jgi:hypothetical protein